MYNIKVYLGDFSLLKDYAQNELLFTLVKG